MHFLVYLLIRHRQKEYYITHEVDVAARLRNDRLKSSRQAVTQRLLRPHIMRHY